MSCFFTRALWRAIHELRESQVATQEDLDALTQQVQQVGADLAAASTKLQAEIDALAQANPALDVTGLQAAVAPLDAAVNAIGDLQPTPPPAP